MHLINQLIAFGKEQDIVHVAIYLAVINLITFLIYRKDKRAAQFSEWRIPESTLHFFMFIGGTIGAFTAQRVLRHKTRKQPFQVIFWFLLLLQIICILYIMTV